MQHSRRTLMAARSSRADYGVPPHVARHEAKRNKKEHANNGALSLPTVPETRNLFCGPPGRKCRPARREPRIRMVRLADSTMQVKRFFSHFLKSLACSAVRVGATSAATLDAAAWRSVGAPACAPHTTVESPSSAVRTDWPLTHRRVGARAGDRDRRESVARGAVGATSRLPVTRSSTATRRTTAGQRMKSARATCFRTGAAHTYVAGRQT